MHSPPLQRSGVDEVLSTIDLHSARAATLRHSESCIGWPHIPESILRLRLLFEREHGRQNIVIRVDHLRVRIKRLLCHDHICKLVRQVDV